MGTNTKEPCERAWQRGTFRNLERLSHWRYKGELARNEPRRWIGAACHDNKFGLYPLGRGKPLKGIENEGATLVKFGSVVRTSTCRVNEGSHV